MLVYRPRTGFVMLVRLGIGILAWAFAGFRMTVVSLTVSAGLAALAWALAVAISGVFVQALEQYYPRLRPHAWTLLAVASPFAIFGWSDILVLCACWAVCAAATWIGMDATTDLITMRRLGLAYGPALTFGPDGVSYQRNYGRSPTVHIAWPDVTEVAVRPGPTGRPALCVDTDSGPLGFVHFHRVHGPRRHALDRALHLWTNNRLTLLPPPPPR